MQEYKKITSKNFEQVNNDANGNPRYAIHFLQLMHLVSDFQKIPPCNRYDAVVKAIKKFGGKRFHNKQYGGGIVFSTYNLKSLCDKLNEG